MTYFLRFSPVIAVVGLIFVVYLVFLKPALKARDGRNINLSQAVEQMKQDLDIVKHQQDLLAGSLTEQREAMLKQSEHASKFYGEIADSDAPDMDLGALKNAINGFNTKALELAGNETAIIELNDRLKQGIAALDKQIRSVDLMDLVGTKKNPTNDVNAMKIQMSKLVELQKSIIEKAREYNQSSKMATEDLKARLKDQAAVLKDKQDAQQELLSFKVQNFMDKQQDIAKDIESQVASLEQIRQNNREQWITAKERVADMMDQMKDRMQDVREKSEQNKDKMREAKERAQDAKERAAALREQLRDRSQR